ncbi:hypothetical protein ACSBR2_004229 [Camellia fascicularis]
MEDAEAVVANMWALMTSWSTPTVFFCVLNLIVAILFFTSKKPLKTHHNNQHPPPPPQSEEDNQQQHNHRYPPPQQLVRAPSLLQRLKSFEFSLYRSEEHPDQSQTQTQIRQPDPPQEQAPILDRQVARSKSDNSGGGGEAPRRPPVGRIKKWKSETVRVEEEEERERERETASYGGGGEEEEEEEEGEGEGVDAQADDFIDRFKKQLKLQRVDSIMRYTDMLKRGLGRSQV